MEDLVDGLIDFDEVEVGEWQTWDCVEIVKLLCWGLMIEVLGEYETTRIVLEVVEMAQAKPWY